MYSIYFYWKDGFELEIPGFRTYDDGERYAEASPNLRSPNYEGYDVIASDDHDYDAEDAYLDGDGPYYFDDEYFDADEGL